MGTQQKQSEIEFNFVNSDDERRDNPDTGEGAEEMDLEDRDPEEGDSYEEKPANQQKWNPYGVNQGEELNENFGVKFMKEKIGF